MKKHCVLRKWQVIYHQKKRKFHEIWSIAKNSQWKRKWGLWVTLPIQAAIIEYQRLVIHKKQQFSSHSSGGWKSKIRVSEWPDSDEKLSPTCRPLSSHCVHVSAWVRARQLPGVPFIRTLVPFRGAPPSWPNHVLRPHLKYHHFGNKFQQEFWEGTCSPLQWKSPKIFLNKESLIIFLIQVSETQLKPA